MFIQDRIYRRKSLHNRFGGQRQGGISTPANGEFIFLFSGKSGPSYGYSDGWSKDGALYFYTGEGQVGDMQFTRGNKALQDHLTDGKQIHLFEQLSDGNIRYVAEMVCTGHHERQAPDKKGRSREVIVFELIPLTAIDDAEGLTDDAALEEDLRPTRSLEELRSRALANSRLLATPMARQVSYRTRSREIKLYALGRATGICEGCGSEAPFVNTLGQPFLEVHHTTRLSDYGPDHPNAVIALCPNCHRRAHYAGDSVVFNDCLRQKIVAKEAQLDKQ
jgi:5-methylcytosine-specific restriction protein A